jgi:hypothetical protein
LSPLEPTCFQLCLYSFCHLCPSVISSAHLLTLVPTYYPS